MLLLPLMLPSGETDRAMEVHEIHLTDRFIRVSDLAVAPGNEDVVLGKLSTGQMAVDIDRAQAKSLIQNRIPGHNAVLRYNGVVRMVGQNRNDVRQGTCWSTRTRIEAGLPLEQESVEAVPCTNSRPANLLSYHHASRTVVAKKSIEANTYLGAVRIAGKPVVTPDSELVVAYRDGPVKVERRVRSLQLGTPGRRVFVISEDGETISVALSGDTEAGPQ